MSTTSLTLQALLKNTTARAHLGDQAPGGVVTGLPAAAQALYLATAATRHAPAPRPGTRGKTLVVVVPTDADVEQYTDDIRFFLASMEGLSDAAAQQAVLPFPSHEVDPYRGLSPHLGVLSQRTRALHAAATGVARVIVASATALLPRLSPPDRLLRASIEIRTGADVDPYALADLLFDAGFSREDPVDEHGEFCVRGGVIDVFPAGSAQPVRLDFVGDTVESIRHYDPASQRSTGEIERVQIVPLREVFTDEGGGRRAEGGRPRASEQWPAGSESGEGGGGRAGGGLVPPKVAGDHASEGGGGRAEGGKPVAGGQWTVDSGSRARAAGPGIYSTSTPGTSRTSTISTYSRGDSGTSTSGTPGTSRTPGTTSEGSEESEQDLSWAWQGDDDVDDEDEPGGLSLPLEAEPPPPPPNYPALLEPGAQLSASLLDFVEQPVIFVCEAEEVEARAEKSLAQLASSHREMIGRGGNPPPPEQLFAPLEEIASLVELGTRLDELEIVEGGGRGAEGGTDPTVASESSTSGTSTPSTSSTSTPSTSSTPSTTPVTMSCRPAVEFRGRIADWVADIKRAREAGETVLFVAATPGRAERTVEVLREYELIAVPVFVDPRQRDAVPARTEMAHAASVLVATGALSRGFHLPSAALQIFAETDVFEEERRPSERRRSAAKTFLSDFRDLKVGDHVVHVDHGIGVFVGLKQIEIDPYGPDTQEFLELRYAGEDKLFVPVERLDLLQKYTGATRPPLDRLGGTTWERAKTRVKKAMRDMAEELLKLYAAAQGPRGPRLQPRHPLAGGVRGRLRVRPHARPADGRRRHQARHGVVHADGPPAVRRRRLRQDRGGHARRLQGGDGRQAGGRSSRRRPSSRSSTSRRCASGSPASPCAIDMVSRFRTQGRDQADARRTWPPARWTSSSARTACCRRTSTFKDLGLLVVDEEQRFGVAHKERIKQMRRKVDVLTMTATPIPRTLNMSLVGIRDMSVIETPPKDRLAIQTNVVRFDQQLIARVVRNEMARGGQVYFVHNRVRVDLLDREPAAAAGAGGAGGRGARADGRGGARAGDGGLRGAASSTSCSRPPSSRTASTSRTSTRSSSTGRTATASRSSTSCAAASGGPIARAYAYLLIPPGNTLSPVARKRLAAIREFSDLGSGFRVAALDLEIRGAGNLLGGEQSGHIEAIGFDMYMKLLEETVRELKGEEIEDETRAIVNLGIDLRIDENYVPEQNQRLSLYRRVAAARTDGGARAYRGGDRGPLRPDAAPRCSTWWTTAGSASSPTASGSRKSTARAPSSSLHSRVRADRTRTG